MDHKALADEILYGEGYLVFDDWFDPKPISNILTRLMQETRPQLVAGGYRPDVLGFRQVQDLLTHPDLLTIGTHVLGDTPAFGSLGTNIVASGSTGMPTHIDYPYFTMVKRPDTPYPALCLQFIWYVCDVEPDMGRTHVYPKSQADFRDSEEKKIIDARAGSLFIGHGAIRHGVEPNTTNKLRPVVLGSYVPFWVRPMLQLPTNIPGCSEEFNILLCSDFGDRIGGAYSKIINE